jgi:hypothetical protein
MLELLGVLTFVNHFISYVCIPAVSCCLPKYFKLKPPEYKKYRKLVHMVCLTHPGIQSDFEVLHLLILMVGKEDGKKEGSLVISGRYFVLHFSFTFLTLFVGLIFHPYWMPAIDR